MKSFALVAVWMLTAVPVFGQTTEIRNDIPGAAPPRAVPTGPVTRPEWDYVRRVEMVPMRDGTKLYTVILIPKGAKNVPMILTRTPYNAEGRAAARRVPNATGNATAMVGRPGAGARAEAVDSPRLLLELGLSDEVFVNAGWIRVYQDVRGKYHSEGPYLMTPPPVGPFNATGADDTTDGYDTIDWLVKNVPESNGRVGMLGSSYEGYTVQMALLHPHPALKVALPESPMTDGWMGDDWFHYGAFRQPNLGYFLSQTSARGAGKTADYGAADDYTAFLQRGSTADMARFLGADELPVLEDRRLASHVRCVLAGTGARHPARQQAAERADDVAAGTLGSGRHVGCDSQLPCGRAEGHQQHHELPGDGSVVPFAGQPRRPGPRPARLGR